MFSRREGKADPEDFEVAAPHVVDAYVHGTVPRPAYSVLIVRILRIVDTQMLYYN